ncbi:hypothetical protein [Roseicyclus persicicus]|uniref:Uncharacterized protein n=1 Tax=Roseicyclus persicicus TaxID=2650661 RepID=A0A7X6H136_9RHOB|nr:hypothetical protein [Roseibacterium persicicum]NKX46068.1 hypothetical protein [Roseibacterium persicicum]
MTRAALPLPLLLALAAPAAAQTAVEPVLAETCRATAVCTAAGDCGPSDLAFALTVTEPEPHRPVTTVTLPGSPPAEALRDATSGTAHAWAADGIAYTLLYIFNSGFYDRADAPEDPPEFLLTMAPIQGRIGDARIYTGTCEAL